MSFKPLLAVYDAFLRDELRRLRKALNLTQAQAADRCGVSYLQFGKYERGETQIPANIMEFARSGFTRPAASTGGFGEAATPYDAGNNVFSLLSKGSWSSHRDSIIKAVEFVDLLLGWRTIHR